jgi:hypothetical protein
MHGSGAPPHLQASARSLNMTAGREGCIPQTQPLSSQNAQGRRFIADASIETGQPGLGNVLEKFIGFLCIA